MPNNKMVKFSVLMANYNRAAYIEEAVNSVKNQSFTDWELIILDDASTDDSIEIIKALQKDDSRIKFYQNPNNEGVGYSKKKLIDLASGEIAAFVDSDDVITPDALEVMYEAHEKHPESIIYSEHWVCEEDLKIVKKGSSRKIPKGESHLSYFGISHLASFKVADYKKTMGLDTHLTKAIDQDLYLKLEEVNGSFFIPKPLYYYRHNAESISLDKGKTKATILKQEVMEKAIERRLQNGQKIPSKKIFNYQKNKELGQKNPITFATLQYYLFQLKVKIKLWLLK